MIQYSVILVTNILNLMKGLQMVWVREIKCTIILVVLMKIMQLLVQITAELNILNRTKTVFYEDFGLLMWLQVLDLMTTHLLVKKSLLKCQPYLIIVNSERFR